MDLKDHQYNQFDAYAEWTDTTAKYPTTAPQGYCSEPSYLALGIADEAGELCTTRPDESRLKEGGDVLWYAARYATKVLGVNFSAIVRDAMSLPDAALGFGPVRNGLAYVAIIAGVEKKRIRDGSMWNNATRALKAEAAYGALVRVVSWVSWELAAAGYSLDEAIAKNMGKLTARLEAGTIHGDGDNR